MKSLSNVASGTAAGGFAVWIIFLFVSTTDSHETELIHKVAMFGLFCVAPLAFSLVPGGEQQGISLNLYRKIVTALPFAVFAAALSFTETRWLAAAMAFPWFLLTLGIAAFGLIRIMTRGLQPLAESAIDAGLVYLPVSAGWLVIYRLGVQPLDYGETIVLLTVIHFLFAGYGSLIIAGLNGRKLATMEHPRRLYAASVFLIVAAMPVVAAGITFSPWLGLIGTLMISVGLVLLAVLTVGWVIPSLNGLVKKILLLIAAAASCAAMVMATLYAYSLATHTLIFDIPTMAMRHGLLNAFGFVTCSLLAWTIVKYE